MISLPRITQWDRTVANFLAHEGEPQERPAFGAWAMYAGADRYEDGAWLWPVFVGQFLVTGALWAPGNLVLIDPADGVAKAIAHALTAEER